MALISKSTLNAQKTLIYRCLNMYEFITLHGKSKTITTEMRSFKFKHRIQKNS